MKALFLFSFLIIAVPLSSQIFQNSFLGEDFRYYKGCLFKLGDDTDKWISYSFYSDINYCKRANENKVIYPDPKYNFNTITDSLRNRVFIVDTVFENLGSEYSRLIGNLKPVLVLRDTATNQIIYYVYDSKSEVSFPFLTSKIDLSDPGICNKITVQLDDFTGEKNIYSSIDDKVILHKNISQKGAFYYLALETYGYTVSVSGKGATILFSDGTKWTKDVKIDADAGSDNFRYSAFIPVTSTDISLFSKKIISKFRLYVYDQEMNTGEAQRFMALVNCVKNYK